MGVCLLTCETVHVSVCLDRCRSVCLSVMVCVSVFMCSFADTFYTFFIFNSMHNLGSDLICVNVLVEKYRLSD